ncbi:alpha/beta fold hydrolase [Devosia beringensis]|uniref:alpha/beta fold hydrolase n=1 Tax=Devosia beringensis TaxID=2657486 RepID=UPI00186B630B|nr:alpha/beta fold hydrolase [Devosia beringensis]
MSPEQILTIVTTLLSAQPDNAAFQTLMTGGHDARYPVTIEACPRPLPAADIEGQTVICGRIGMPENHDNPEGNRLDLAFAVLKARSLAPAPDPVVYLHGGPGGRAVPDIAFNAGLFDNLRERRDLVLFDQRASGISARTVTCANTLADNIVELGRTTPDANADPDAPDPLKLCLDEIESSGIVLSDYNTTQNAHDVRALMTGLGYPQYNAYGISYGTKLGLELLRADPDGLRAIVLDSISPPDARAYDTNSVSADLAIGAVVDQCAADTACAAAFPDFEQTLNAVAAKLAETPFPATNTPPEIDVMTLINLFEDRNSLATNRQQTSYIPAIVDEWSKGTTQIYDLYVAGKLTPAQTPDTIIAPFIDKVRNEELIMGYALLNKAEELRRFNVALDILLQEVSTLSVTADYTQLESELDKAMTAALADMDVNTMIAMAKAYGRLAFAQPDKAAIEAFVAAYMPEQHLGPMQAMIAAMTAGDVTAFFAAARRDTGKYFDKLANTMDLAIYACQEDIPYNSLEGYQAAAARYRFSFLTADDAAIQELYDTCANFTPAPREGFHERVSSDLPVLALAGLNDTQTNNDAADYVAETMANGQAVTFPETGHGVIQFSQCAKDIAAAFIEDPMSPVNSSCTAALKASFATP